MKPNTIPCQIQDVRTMDYSHHLQGYDTIGSKRSFKSDVLIIGSGAGGAVCAEILAKSGLKTTVLEAGFYTPPKEMNHKLFPMLDSLAWDKANAGADDGSLRVVHGKVIGGSTIMHMLTMTEIPPHILKTWQQHHGLEELEDQAISAAQSYVKDIMNIKPISREMVNANGDKWIQGCDALGYYWKLNERNSGTCVQAGRCHTGCPFGGKLSMDVSFIPRALNHGAQVFTGAYAHRIHTHQGRAVKVEAHISSQDPQAKTISVDFHAPIIISACGALQTPGLLLRSQLQSPSGTVGHKLCVQPGINVLGVFDHKISPWQGITNPIHIDEWSQKPYGAFFIEPGMLDPAIISDFIPLYGTAHSQAMMRYAYMSAAQILYSDDGTYSKVEVKNSKANVRFNLSQEDFAHIRTAMHHSAEILLAAGAEEVYLGQRQPLAIKSLDDLSRLQNLSFQREDFHFESVHIHGSCPMGVNPQNSVVSPKGNCHHVENLYIADASVFASALGTNTTLPTATLAAYIANQLTA